MAYKGLFGQKKYSKTNVYEAALDRAETAFKLFDHCAVAFSGGKDSTVTLQIALTVAKALNKLPLRVLFFDEEAIPYETERYMRRIAARPDVQLEWYCLQFKHLNSCSRKSPWWFCWDKDHKDLWVRPMPKEGITDIKGFKKGLMIPEMAGLYFDPKKYGNCGMFMGIRAQESMTRLRAVSHVSKAENFIIKYNDLTVKGNLSKVYPVYDWLVEDIWTAFNKFGWDYNDAYDRMEMAGINHTTQRIAPPYGAEPMQMLWMYKVCFPELWDRMWNRVPGADAAARYSRTLLYAFKGLPDKPDNMTWEEIITANIKRYAPADQARVANRVRQEIQKHYNQTKDPILEFNMHPDTGVSWKYLYMLSIRGDFKNRKIAILPGIGTKEYFKLKEKYDEERKSKNEAEKNRKPSTDKRSRMDRTKKIKSK